MPSVGCSYSTSRASSTAARTSFTGEDGTPAARSSLQPLGRRPRAERVLEDRRELVAVPVARGEVREARVVGELGPADRLAERAPRTSPSARRRRSSRRRSGSSGTARSTGEPSSRRRGGTYRRDAAQVPTYIELVQRRLEERDVAVAADAVAARAPEAGQQRERRHVAAGEVDQRQAALRRRAVRARRSAPSSRRAPASCSRSRPRPPAARSSRSPRASSRRSAGSGASGRRSAAAASPAGRRAGSRRRRRRRATSSSKRSRPAGSRRSSETLFLLRLNVSKKSESSPSWKGGTYRPTSPPDAGSSILITSAPRSASCSVAHGPAPNCSIARMRTSASGSARHRQLRARASRRRPPGLLVVAAGGTRGGRASARRPPPRRAASIASATAAVMLVDRAVVGAPSDERERCVCSTAKIGCAATASIVFPHASITTVWKSRL